MSSELHTQLARLARELGRPVNEIRTLYMLEAFLRRLQQTKYARSFILKGGVLLAAHDMRRPTRDVDMQAVAFDLTEEHLNEMVAAVAGVSEAGGLVFDPVPQKIEPIREGDEYEGLRVTVGAHLNGSRDTIKLDISTGDPIWPEPVTVQMPQLLGGYFPVLGHPLSLVVAEKAVTMLSRGATSTRWRDQMDIRNLSRNYDFDASELLASVSKVAAYRKTPLGSAREAVSDWPERAQAKWSAWRGSNGLEELTLANFGDQLEDVLAFVEPVLDGSVAETSRWDHGTLSWTAAPQERGEPD